MAGFKCAECNAANDTVRLAVLDGYDQVRASFPLPLTADDCDKVHEIEDRGGEVYHIPLCRNCRNRPVE